MPIYRLYSNVKLFFFAIKIYYVYKHCHPHQHPGAFSGQNGQKARRQVCIELLDICIPRAAGVLVANPLGHEERERERATIT